jgi:hypothetical protein
MSKATNEQVQAKLNRQFKLFREIVEHAALEPPPPTSEQLAAGGKILIDLWNEGAERIEAMFGAGYFPVRLEHRGALEMAFKKPDPTRFPDGLPEHGPGSFWHALTVVTVLTEQDGHDQIFDVMRDALLAFEIPLSDIEHHAGAANGLWRTQWRKDKIGEAARLAVSEAWVERENDENLETQNTQTVRRRIARAHHALEQWVRVQPELKDFTIGRAIVHRPTPYSIMGHVIELGEPEDNKPKADAKLASRGTARSIRGPCPHELSRRGQRTKPPRN